MFTGFQQSSTPLKGSNLVLQKQSRGSVQSNNVLPLLYDDVMTTIADVQQEVVHLGKEQVTQAGLQVSGFSAGYCFTQFGVSANEVMAPDLVDRDTVEDVGACLISQTYEFPFEEEELTPEVYRVLNTASQNIIQHVQYRLEQEVSNMGASHSVVRRRRQPTNNKKQAAFVSDVLGGHQIVTNLIRSSSNLEMVAMLKNVFWYCIDNCIKQNTLSIDEDDDMCYLHQGLATATFSGEITVIA
eukprot:TRINITY_DN4820_c0_g1_i2.p1 TRINITY_DN4820_c0_g1~~TRINITY_DN4820_c0_g1_i2.p1  ORF type:complete len:268 (+),score=25.90 TRINITY_DN4820_c0_g1_i2:81-806(+)